MLRSQFELDLVGIGHTRGRSLDLGQLIVGNRQRVVLPRVEVWELINPIENVCDKLLQEYARCNSDSASKRARDCVCKIGDVSVVNHLVDSRSRTSSTYVDIASPH